MTKFLNLPCACALLPPASWPEVFVPSPVSSILGLVFPVHREWALVPPHLPD